MTAADLLPLDLPTAVRPVPTVRPLVCACGSPDWIAIKPGTASTAEMYPASNIVALRADDGVATEVWCMHCWLARFPVLTQPPALSAADVEYLSWTTP
jgi:hypothetical protein